jgi:[ribosomal protein S5]-alanine N-acetyltransferase
MDFEVYKTDRLILRKLSPNVLRYIFENHSDQEIKALLGANSDEEFEKERKRHEGGYSTYNRSFEHFQILDKVSMHIIGGCGFHTWYLDHRRAEIGYSLTDENYRNKGIMSEAIKVVIEHGFTNMNLHRIEAFVATYNTPSLNLMAKFNFTREGLLREHYYVNDRFEDSVLFSRLVSDQ